MLAVRDLASGRQLLGLPVTNPVAEEVVSALTSLFAVLGAPLVLKSDNGSAFRAEHLKGFLRRWQVWALYSPPGEPGYNGAIEASIGSLKTRTQFEAYRNGHPGAWTSSDLEQARQLANTLARPRATHGPTPLQAWDRRRPPSLAQRDRFGDLVSQLEKETRGQDGLALDAPLDHYEQAALHRRVLQKALVESGYLTITRRRIPQTFFGQKAAKIM
jgi:transposase InsO family protein